MATVMAGTIRNRRWPVVLLWTILAGTLLVQLVHYQFDAWPQLDRLLGGWLYTGFEGTAAAMCLWRAWSIRDERLAWALVGVAMLMWASADLVYTYVYADMAMQPVPTVSDIVFLAAYPLIAVAIVLLTRSRIQAPRLGLIVDGVLAALAVTTVFAAFMVAPIVDNAGGDAATIAVAAAYPTFDLVLLGMILAGCALASWRPGRAWLVMAAAIAAFTIADAMYVLSISVGDYQGSVVDWLYSLAAVLFAAAPWVRATARRVEPSTRWASYVVPALFAVAALSVLLSDHFLAVPAVAVVLATLTLLISIARTMSGYGVSKALTQSRRDALTDPLTEIGNRTSFTESLTKALASRRGNGASLSVLFLDLNDFKAINDALGHAVGDQCLQEVARRLSRTLREHETCARLGGDEFGVVLEHASAPEAGIVAERVAAAINAPMALAGRELEVGAAIGIAVAEDDSSVDTLLHQADVAMYEAKERSATYELFSGTIAADSGRLELATELRHGIERGELELFYQPQIELRGAGVVAVEALVRWRHPHRGLLLPGQFMEAAARSHQLSPLTHEVLRLAVEALASWRVQGIDLAVAVNVPGSVLGDSLLAPRIAELLAARDLPPDGLLIELTEDAVGTEAHQAERTLTELAERGIAISVDDFGQGHSSLSRLRRLPISELKVDQAFVAGMLENANDAAIVRSTINLGHDLGLRIVAEGVEDEATMDQLRAWDCDRAQGYLIARPMPAEELSQWLLDRPIVRELRITRPQLPVA
jgi:diguanylate cyclase (GGDEF)-like protein